MMEKYFKPKSLTWWTAVVPVVAGLIVATEPLHGWGRVVEVIDNVSGGLAPAVMINAGLVALGLRGAVR